jgi:DNA-binding CsgD family transcriptional regulator
MRVGPQLAPSAAQSRRRGLPELIGPTARRRSLDGRRTATPSGRSGKFASATDVVRVVASLSVERVRGELVRLSHRCLGVRDFTMAAARAVRPVVPFEGVCMVTIDPSTLLPTGEVVENGLPANATARLTEIEIREPDFNKFDALARAAQPVASLSRATEGKLDRSRRQRELRRPSGFEDELRAVLASGSETWGALTLLRERGRPHFSDDEVRRVNALTRALADGLRRAVLLGELTSSDETDVQLILLAPDNSMEQASQAARELIQELGPDGAGRDQVPVVIQAVANRARAIASGEARDDPIARARFRTRSNGWLAAHGSMLGEGPAALVTVILEPARAPELAPLLAAAYDLSERERRVTELVARGLGTSDIAARLHLSPWTVQDHLKAIFTKTGTGSRGELVARLFLDHDAARLSP